ncbi:uncharacterized protein LOC109810135 [Cajanus cajan]|uniref:uncharacterized protein LOC109810135 n=1 Tax=Cajanus cajan TaxID=3821 RepID=UPI00098DCBAF|nr:uncharacterized protein LOC109810135 [Cajanus cajan]
MKGSTISPSLISLCLTVSLLCATFAYQIEQYCYPKSSHGSMIPNQPEKKQGQDEFKDNAFKTLNAIKVDRKPPLTRQPVESMDAHKPSYKVPKKSEDKQLLDGDFAVVDLEIVDHGEYVLKIKKLNLSSTNEDEVQRANQMAQNGAMLLLYGEMLLEMGEKLMAHSQSSIYSIFKMPTPPKLKYDR